MLFCCVFLSFLAVLFSIKKTSFIYCFKNTHTRFSAWGWRVCF